jgi:hypothetical protein
VEGQVVDLEPTRMGGSPGLDVLSAVGVEVVQHQVDDLTGGDVDIQQIEEGEEDFFGPTRSE